MNLPALRGLFVLLGACLSAACAAAPVAPAATATASLPPAATPLPTFTPAPTPVPGGLFVDAAQDLGPISPLVYGSNYGPWLFVTLEMQPFAEQAGLNYLRFPGGNWGDLNDLETYQVDQFVALARQLGAEPAISVRLNGGTPEQAAGLVHYANVSQRYGLRYWSIGNEPSLYPDGYDTERYNREWRQWAEAMRAVDPAIQLIGPDVHQFTADLPGNPKDPAGRDWIVEFLRANGDMVDVVSIHRYPFPREGGAPPLMADLRANSREWDETIPALRRLVREHTGRDLPVAVTEVNSSWASNSGGEATMDSHYNAIWWGDSLARMIRQGTYLVAQFALVGNYGLMGKYDVYPIYYVYQLYQHLGTRLVQASSDQPDLNVLAARRDDGALTVLAVNLALEPAQVALRLAGFPAGEPAEAWLFDPTHAAEAVPPASLHASGGLSLPAQSLAVLVFTEP